MKRFAGVVIAVASLVTAACFNIEQTLTLDRNMSGTAGFSMAIDMEPIAGFMATMKHSMMGKPGTPTAADIAEATKELQSSMSRSKPKDMEAEKKELQASLPAGVRLLDAGFKEDGFKIAGSVQLGFDHPSKLDQVKLNSKSGAAAAGPLDNPMESPFGGLKVVDEGSTILITSPAVNPVGDQKAEMSKMPGVDAALKAQMETLMKTLRVAFKITAPFTVVEHNAHRRDGNTLVWEYNLASLEKMSAAQAAQGIRVRYRK